MKIDTPKISIIMPSYLGDYPNAAQNRDGKLQRAIISFLEQTYAHRELILVSDGCEATENVYKFLKNNSGKPISSLIKLIKIPKQLLFSGAVRNAGIQAATGQIIAYLDTDDIIQPHHCESIVNQIGQSDWVYYDDWVATEPLLQQNAIRGNHPEFGHIGTSSIAHKRKLIASWCDGYGHDFKFVEDLLATSHNFRKITNCGYVVCHVKGRCDF